MRRRLNRHGLEVAGAGLSFAWPSNEIAVMGADRAASIICRKELASAPDPVQRLRELVTEYSERLMTPYIAAERGMSTT